MSSRKALSLIMGLVLAGILIPCDAGYADRIVYQNTAPVSGTKAPDGFLPFTEPQGHSDPVGDEITLTGSACTITQFDLLLSSTSLTALTSLTLTFYLNDGYDGNEWFGAPGTSFWTEPRNSLTVNGPTTVTFLPNVFLSGNSFTWIVESQSRDAGLATCNPPLMGNSDDYYWDRDGNDLQWYALNFYDSNLRHTSPVANFGAIVRATPEPSVMVLLCLGGLILARRRTPGRRTG